jgi:hypothetical protein
MDDASSSVTTVDHGGMTLTSVGVSEADVKTSLTQTTTDADPKGADDKPDKPEKKAKLTPSDHARALGQRGGKAAAEKRAADGGKASDDEPEPATAKADSKAAERPGPAADDEGEDLPDDKLTERQRRRVEVATRKQAEARRELERERAERAAERQRYEAELAAHRVRGDRPAEAREGAERQEWSAQPDHSGKPREEDFERHSDYLDARDDWNRKEWTREQERQRHAEREVHTYKGHVDEFLRHVTPELKEEIDPELLEARPYFLMGDGEPLTPDNIIAAEIVFTGKQAPAVLRHLSSNLKELQRLRSLRNHADIRVEVQVLARTLGSKTDATAGDPPVEGERASKPATSKAHPPVRPVTGQPFIADGEAGPREGEDFDAWYRRTEKKRA